MQSTTSTRVNILPVLDIGPPPGASGPRGGDFGAPFDSHLHAAPRDDSLPDAQKESPLQDDPAAESAPRSDRSPASREHAEPPTDSAAAASPEAGADDVPEDSAAAPANEAGTEKNPPASDATPVAQSLAALAAVVVPAPLPGEPATADGGTPADAPMVEPAVDAGQAPHPAAIELAPALPVSGAASQALPPEPLPAASDVAEDALAGTSTATEGLATAGAAEPEATGFPHEQDSPGAGDKSADKFAGENSDPFAAGQTSDSTARHLSDPAAATAVAAVLDDSRAGTALERTAAPPVAAAELNPAPSDAARVMPAAAPSPDAAGGLAPRSRLPAAVLAPEPSAGQPAVQIDSARLLQRVARAFHAAQQRDGEMQLRLSPPELGSLRLQVQVGGGALTARLEAETSAARTAILDNLPALRERLLEQGVRIERFEVDLMQRHSGGAGGMPDRPRDHDRSLPQLPPATTNARPTAAPQPARAVQPRVAGPGRLNVIV